MITNRVTILYSTHANNTHLDVRKLPRTQSKFLVITIDKNHSQEKDLLRDWNMLMSLRVTVSLENTKIDSVDLHIPTCAKNLEVLKKEH